MEIRVTPVTYHYGKVLYELGIQQEQLEQAKKVYQQTDQLQRVLCNPVIGKKEKHRVIERIFAPELHSFLKVLVNYNSVHLFSQICDVYTLVKQQENEILGAILYYVTEPEEYQLEKILAYLHRRFDGKKVQLKLVECKELVGGFILCAGDYEMDWSMKGRFRMLEQRLTRR